MDRLHNQVLALAGLFQAGWLVDRLAFTGMADCDALQTSIDSVFALNPESTEAVYGGVAGVRPGLNLLRSVLKAGSGDEQGRVIRYAINLLHLESRLRSDPDMLRVLRSRLEALAQEHETHNSIDDAIVMALDALYQDTLSTLRFRVQVAGDAQHLQNERIAQRVRALLLAGIRSAMLWRQLGGSRWHLLFRRGRLQVACDELLEA